MAEAAQDEIVKRPFGWWIPIVVGLSLLSVVGGGLWVGMARTPGRPSGLPVADVSSERLLSLGSVVGFAGAYETHAWVGIPYAQPPVGPLRWRAPRPPEAWADTLDALAFGSPCSQLESSLGGVPAEEADGFAGSEDCLHLSIWAPRSEPEAVPRGPERLPVMLWIHGGGNVRGFTGSGMYDGARLAGTEKVVVVSVNYRLGPLGWFSHPALREEAVDDLEASGNFGTLDQIRALEWVQSHVEEFGGDPGNVTIFGESAGGTNVFALLLAESASGLFHRAIVQSGSTDSVSRAEAEHPLPARSTGQLRSASEAVVSLLTAAGVVPDRSAARRYAAELPPADLVEFLRSRSSREILNVYRQAERPDEIEVPQPIRDGALLPRGDWVEALRAGRFNQVPLIVGSNRDEMKLYFSQDEDHVRKRFGLLYRIRNPEDYARRARYHSDLWAVRGVTRPAAAIHDSGWSEVYAYRFDWDEQPRLLGQEMSQLLGAAHGFELPFLFGTFDLGDPMLSRLLFPAEGQPSREILAERMMAYWAEFARTGRPGRGGRGDLPEWLSWVTGGDRAANLMVLDSEGGGGIRVAQTKLSRDHVIAAVDAESDLGQADKCALFHDLFADRPDWDPEEFRRIGRLGCADFAPAGEAEAGSPR